MNEGLTLKFEIYSSYTYLVESFYCEKTMRFIKNIFPPLEMTTYFLFVQGAKISILERYVYLCVYCHIIHKD